jgi:hypothetical protein
MDDILYLNVTISKCVQSIVHSMIRFQVHTELNPVIYILIIAIFYVQIQPNDDPATVGHKINDLSPNTT